MNDLQFFDRELQTSIDAVSSADTVSSLILQIVLFFSCSTAKAGGDSHALGRPRVAASFKVEHGSRPSQRTGLPDTAGFER